MSKSFERYQKRKLISSYFSVVLSIGLVLFLLGILGLLVLNTYQKRKLQSNTAKILERIFRIFWDITH